MILRRLFNVSDARIERTRHRYRNSESVTAKWLLTVGKTFFDGYHCVLEERESERVSDCAEAIDDELRGFFYEGIGAGLALKDLLSIRSGQSQNHFQRFLETRGTLHPEVMYVGMGMTYGRAGLSPLRKANRIDKNFRRFIFDGYAFCRIAAYKHHCEKLTHPKWLVDDDKRYFDLGVGRCAWFVENGDAHNITRALSLLSTERQEALWEGLGVSMTYAGKASAETVRSLKAAAGVYASKLEEGSRTACAMRQRGKNLARHSSETYALFS